MKIQKYQNVLRRHRMYKYKNDTDHAVIYRDRVWQRDEELEVPYIVPSSLGLTCTQEGSAPDPVLYHGDIVDNSQ